MTRLKLAATSIGLLLITLPVWSDGTARIIGFPVWAFVVFLSTTVYAVAIAWLLDRYWKLMAEIEDANPPCLN